MAQQHDFLGRPSPVVRDRFMPSRQNPARVFRRQTLANNRPTARKLPVFDTPLVKGFTGGET